VLTDFVEIMYQMSYHEICSSLSLNVTPRSIISNNVGTQS